MRCWQGEIPKVGSVNSAERGALRERRRNTFWIASLAVIAVSWAPCAHAQINPFRSYKGPTLTKEDVAAGSAAAQKLLQDDSPTVGQAETWVGPKTGNQGTLTIQRVFERSSMPCRAVASQVVYKKTQTRRDFTLTACRTATGEWKLAK